MVKYAMEQCRSDPYVFPVILGVKVELIMAIHVDNIVVAASDEIY